MQQQPLGINQNQQQLTYVKDLKPNLKNINLQVIVLDINKPTQTKDGHEVRTVRVADKTGSINLSVWNNYGSLLKEGDILRLSGCFTQIWKASLQLKVSAKGSLVKFSDFMMVFNEQPDMSILPPDVLKMVMEQQGGTGGSAIGPSGTSKNGNGSMNKT